jgi:catechol 2,3-dioxygenase-like lactoylglutathione lyase family enzyme
VTGAIDALQDFLKDVQQIRLLAARSAMETRCGADMFVLDHVSITVRDLGRARAFYDAIMAALGVTRVSNGSGAIGYGTRSDPVDTSHTYFSLVASADFRADDARHWCFKASSREQVDAFHRAGTTHGGLDDGAPALRPEYHASYYAAFLRDPEGNRLEVVSHEIRR